MLYMSAAWNTLNFIVFFDQLVTVCQFGPNTQSLKSKVFKYAKWPSKWLKNESLVSDLMK